MKRFLRIAGIFVLIGCSSNTAQKQPEIRKQASLLEGRPTASALVENHILHQVGNHIALEKNKTITDSIDLNPDVEEALVGVGESKACFYKKQRAYGVLKKSAIVSPRPQLHRGWRIDARTSKFTPLTPEQLTTTHCQIETTF